MAKVFNIYQSKTDDIRLKFNIDIYGEGKQSGTRIGNIIVLYSCTIIQRNKTFDDKILSIKQ